ncbi:MAG: isopeptide-forming domain-containing fimbrial protein [Gammaproteobacteria bacterium]|nr:isopeptide-forming domain-containing fimbrial protein [Gammaproteobacteria bacterium]
MKFVIGKTGLVFRLGVMMAALLLGQQAMAVGTEAGTTINNTANVDYEVAGVPQDDIDSNTVSFVVDRRIDFDLAPLGGALVDIAPGQTDSFFDFLLTNTSNSSLDFNLVLQQMTSGSVRGEADTGTMASVDYAVSAFSVNDPGGTPDPDPVRNGPQYVDELAADDSIRIRVFGDAATTMLNNQVAGVQLDATAAFADGVGGSEGAALTEAADTVLGVENVFAEDGATSDGVQIAYDGWKVLAAELTIDKSYVILDDGFGGTYPIPGAVVEYTITVTNASTTAAADSVVITDTLDTGLAFLADEFGGGSDMTLNGAGCTEESDADGCLRSGQDLTFNAAAIAQNGGTLVVVYRVTIEGSLPTP